MNCLSLGYPSLRADRPKSSCTGPTRTSDDFALVLWNESSKGCLWGGTFRTLMGLVGGPYKSHAQKQPKNRFPSPSQR